MQDNIPNIRFIGFADVKVPELKEMSGKDYIYFGEDNLFPNEIIRMLNKSSKHNAIVFGKVNYIIGKGIAYPDGSDFVPNNLEKGNDFLKKLCIDIETFGGFYVEGHFNKAGTVGAWYHVPFQNVRSNKDNTQFHVKDWNTTDRKEKADVIPAYNPNIKEGKFIIAYKEYRPDLKTYAFPSYMGAFNAIETDIEISKYHLSTIKNGMFASKMINFNQGTPSEEEQKNVETRFKKKFTGSENAGNIVISFNDDPAKAPTILDLSSTDLDKHFDILNKTVQQEIFVGHQITSPMLFGIRVEGQLGGRSEMRDAYEIFKNTYINDKQQMLEIAFDEMSKLMGKHTGLKITPVEPISFELSENTLLQIAPKEWLLEKAGIDPAKYPSTQTTTPVAATNETLANLSGRQQQGLLRIVRLFTQGKLSKQQAALQLKAFGLSDDDVNMYLGLDDDPNTDDQKFSSQDEDEILLAAFAACGESKEDYHVVRSAVAHKFEVNVMANDAAVLDLIRKDKRITPEVIASTLKIAQDDVRNIIKTMEREGVLSSKATRIGQDVIIERSLTTPLKELTDKKPRTLEYKVMYSYEGVRDSRNRAFCARLLELNRFYSRAEIETMSRRLGYSVWDRRGGFWNDGETIQKHCRHHWASNLVVKKK